MRHHRLVVMICMFLLTWPGFAVAEWSGSIGFQARGFFYNPLFADQDAQVVSASFEPAYRTDFGDTGAFNFKGFARYDSADDARTHLDVRELLFGWSGDDWRFRIGAGKVFWGVTEAQHLVDIINQTDLVEFQDGEDKLGQPMARLLLQRDWGALDFFVLPYFRDRTFAQENGRLRLGPVIQTEDTRYESAAEEWHTDLAIRYTHQIDAFDVGLSWFHGTGREPTFVPELRFNGAAFVPVLVPLYEQIDQFGLSLQWTAEALIAKLEVIYRDGQQNADAQEEGFIGLTGGIEYTIGIDGSSIEVGFIAEWLYDDRDNDATTAFENDLFLAVRVTANDIAGSELLGAVIQDLEGRGETVITMDASRRFGDRWKMSLRAIFLLDVPPPSPLRDLRDDDFIQIEMSYFF